MKHRLIKEMALLTVIATVTFAVAQPAAMAHDGAHGEEAANGHHFVPKTRKAPTTPATRFSGNTPIDESNGIVMNSGTYGLPNKENEAWAESSTWAVSLAERPYSYHQKARFIKTLDERINHYEAAVWNYGRVTDSVSKPEGKAHAEKAVADLNPRIEKARSAWAKAKSSGPNQWESAQNDAKRAFVELQSFNYGMHKNVR